MHIAVIGATGMVGRRLVDEAVGRGHRVTALSRRPGQDARVDTRAVDLAEAGAVDPHLEKVDAAILTVRLPPGEESALLPLTGHALDACASARVRLLVIGGAGALRSPRTGTRVADDTAYVPAALQSLARTGVDQMELCLRRLPELATYLSPPALLEPGDRTGRYRRGGDVLLTDHAGVSRISVEDLAVAAIDEVEQPGSDRHFTVAAASSQA